MSFTLSDFQPHRHQIRGRRGDGIPATEIVFQFGYPEAVDKDDFSVLCQLRDSAGALVHTFVPVLQDNDDLRRGLFRDDSNPRGGRGSRAGLSSRGDHG